MPNDFLEKIVAEKKALNKSKAEYYRQIKSRLSSTEFNRYQLFKNQLSESKDISLIAEIKKASPSQGLIREEFDVLSIAKTYQEHGAKALSVLTEEKFFLGKPAYIKQVSEEVNLPILTKDFILEDGQIYESAANGASAVLLIVALLSLDELKTLMATAASLDLDALVEVHDREELDIALKAQAEIIGINNRNLKTFEVDLKTSEELIKDIPEGTVVVAESGISSHEEVKHLESLGANAVLIGETFMRHQDIGEKVDELMGRNS